MSVYKVEPPFRCITIFPTRVFFSLVVCGKGRALESSLSLSELEAIAYTLCIKPRMPILWCTISVQISIENVTIEAVLFPPPPALPALDVVLETDLVAQELSIRAINLQPILGFLFELENSAGVPIVSEPIGGAADEMLTVVTDEVREKNQGLVRMGESTRTIWFLDEKSDLTRARRTEMSSQHLFRGKLWTSTAKLMSSCFVYR